MENCKIIILDETGNKQNRFIVELSALLGFYSVATEFPMVTFADEYKIEKGIKYFIIKNSNMNKIEVDGNKISIDLVEDEIEQIKFFETVAQILKEMEENSRRNETIKKEQLEFSTEALEKIKHENRLNLWDDVKNRGVNAIFSNGFLNSDKNNDLLPDSLNVKIYVDNEMSQEEIVAAANISARFAMDITEYEFPITTSDATIIGKENVVVVKEIENEKDGKGIWIDGKEGIKTLYLKEHKDKLVEFSGYICENLSNLNLDVEWGKIGKKDKMEESKESENLIFQKEYDIAWEVDQYKKIISNELLPVLAKGDKVKIHSSLSEDLEVRDTLKKEIENLLKEKELAGLEIDLFCSYKEGYSWIDEKVIPKLVDLKKGSIEKIDICFKAFLPKGESEWKDENGAVPSYNIASENNPNRWLDLPIRYLQELYPIDDTISEKIGLERDKINFKEYAESEDLSYEIVVYGRDSEIILKDSLKIEYSERAYIDEFPDLGLVHPTTGYLTIYVNDKKVIEKNIKTDLENIWDIYQKETLPACKDEIIKVIDSGSSSEIQPFFSKLQLDIDVSEPNYRLNSREDLISSIDSFHEDIYFVGLDYFKILGQRLKGENFDSPGLIYPVIRNVYGKPKMKVSLYRVDKTIENIRSIDEVSKEIRVKQISLEDGILEVVYSIENLEGVTKEVLVNLFLQLSDNDEFKEGLKSDLKIKVENIPEFTLEIKKNLNDMKGVKKIEEINLYENEIIGYDQYIEIMRELKNVEGIRVKEIGESYQKRKIYSVEFIPDYKGYVSQNKLINNRPVYLVNSRHHANEVSATNSSFMLIKELLTNSEYKDFSKKLNLVIIPFENVDGGAIHYELQKDNPNWIFHTARFNSLGKEFGGEYFKDNTIHTEAKALTKVWREWLPDIITDNHGVPSHEWAQQFSGYTSPSFKGFWLPRSLIYGYFWWLNGKEFLGNEILSKKMEKVVADSINAHENISKINEDWRDRFEKYAHKWMPKLFPADYFENLIMYWIPFKFDFNHKYASIRYPWITAVMFTSEVADETAQGDYLNLCAKTHYYHNIATIDMMLKSKLCFESGILKADNGLKIKNTRLRPIV